MAAWKTLQDPHNPENRNAGNGGDLVKHTVYLVTLATLLEHAPWSRKLCVRECHAGRGMYRVSPADPRARRFSRLTHGPLQQARSHLLQQLDCDDGWYPGSAALVAELLAHHPHAHHELYEWSPTTRRILTGVMAQLAPSCRILGSPDGCFDGETHIGQALPGYSRHDVVLLDPFALWRRQKLAYRRARYRAIVDGLNALGPDAPQVLWFFTWDPSLDDIEDHLHNTHPAVVDGYAALQRQLAPRCMVQVRWRWDLPCTMWLRIDESLAASLIDKLRHQLDALAEQTGENYERSVSLLASSACRYSAASPPRKA